jgi:uncharacterized UPF0146 family protein
MCDTKQWKVNDRSITEEEALKFVYPSYEELIERKYDIYATDICEDKANTLACVYKKDIYNETCMYYFGTPYLF